MTYFLWVVTGVFILLAILLVTIAKKFSRVLRFVDGKPLPMPEGAHLLFGHTFLFIGTGTILQVLEKWAGEFGKLFRVRVGLQRVVVSSDFEFNRQAFLRRPAGFMRIQSVTAGIKTLAPGVGLFSAEGDDWTRMRRLSAPAFTKRLVEQRSGVIDQHLRVLMQQWSQECVRGAVIDPIDGCAKTTFNIIMHLVFGVDMNAPENRHEEWGELMRVMFFAASWRGFAPLEWYKWFRTPWVRKEDAFAKTGVARTRERLAQVRSGGAAEQVNMLAALNADGELSDEDICANTTQFVLAGSDTSGNTMAWLPWAFANDAAMQERVRSEIAAGRQRDAAVNVVQLPIVVATVREALRLYSPAPVMAVECVARQTLTASDGRAVDLEPGDLVFMLTRLQACDEEAIPNANKFDPFRWLVDDEKAVSTLMTRLRPFGEGPRVCPGQQLAMLELQQFVAMFARNFRAHLVPHAKPPIAKTYFTSAPEGAVVRLEQLTDQIESY